MKRKNEDEVNEFEINLKYKFRGKGLELIDTGNNARIYLLKPKKMLLFSINKSTGDLIIFSKDVDDILLTKEMLNLLDETRKMYCHSYYDCNLSVLNDIIFTAIERDSMLGYDRINRDLTFLLKNKGLLTNNFKKILNLFFKRKLDSKAFDYKTEKLISKFLRTIK